MDYRRFFPRVLINVIIMICAVPTMAQEEKPLNLNDIKSQLEKQNEYLRHKLDQVSRQVDDLMFFHRLGDIAEIDMARITGPPLKHQPNPTAQGVNNPWRFRAYVFIPKNLNKSKKQPLIILPHGGVHSNFSSGVTNILRELLTQGYTIVAPEYRGSTGYGLSLIHI